MLIVSPKSVMDTGHVVAELPVLIVSSKYVMDTVHAAVFSSGFDVDTQAALGAIENVGMRCVETLCFFTATQPLGELK